MKDEVDPKELAAAMRDGRDNLLAVVRSLRSQGFKRAVFSLVTEFEDTADLLDRGLMTLEDADDLAVRWALDAQEVARVMATMFYAVKVEHRN